MTDTTSETQNCSKKSKLVDYDEEKDLISSLPDAILCQILSFMPTKYAVRTSLLSTRWKPLWTCVPTIDFCNKTHKIYGCFMNILDRFLLLHKLPNINKFHLQYYGYYDPHRINSWICTAIERHVQEFVLTLKLNVMVEMPRSLYTSTNLVVLKLDGEVLFQVVPVFMPNLKVLHLRSLKFLDDDAFKKLLSGCPVLEELHIESCSMDGDVFFRVSTPVFLPSLKVLHLRSLKFLDDDSFKNLLSGCPVLEEFHILTDNADNMKTLCICSSTLKKLHIRNFLTPKESCQYGVVIKSPALKILTLFDSVLKVFDGNEIPFLVEADFSVRYYSGYGYERSDDCYNAVVGMLGKISNVQRLKLHDTTLEVVTQAPAYNLLLFHNLTHLHIGIRGSELSMLIDLLGHIPNLNVLVFKKNHKSCNCVWDAAPKCVPKCLSVCLETIEFSGFAGKKEEMKLVKYLLGNAMVLKELTLTSWTRNKKKKANILKFPRGSSTCQIDLIYYNYGSPVKWP